MYSQLIFIIDKLANYDNIMYFLLNAGTHMTKTINQSIERYSKLITSNPLYPVSTVISSSNCERPLKWALKSMYTRTLCQ